MKKITTNPLSVFLIVVLGLLIWWRADTFYTKNNTYANGWYRFIGIAENMTRTEPDTARLRENITTNNLDLRRRRGIDQTDTALSKPLNLLHPGRLFFWWQTPVKNLSPDSALQHFYRHEFKNWRGNPFKQPANDDHYWFYIILKNESSHDTVVMWQFADQGFTVTLYQVMADSHCIRIDSSSMHTPMGQRPFNDQTLGFPIYRKKGEAGVYMAKVQKTIVRSLGVWQGINFRDAITAGNGKDVFTTPMFFGFFPFAILFNLIFFFVLKERIYLLQALYITAAAVIAGNNIHYFSLTLPDWLYVPFSYMPLLLPVLFASLFFTLIFKAFTGVKEVSTAVNRVLNFSLAINGFALVCSIVTYVLYFAVSEPAYISAVNVLRWPGIIFLTGFFPLHIFCALYLLPKVDGRTKIYCASVGFTLFLWAFNTTNFAGLTNRTFIHPNNLIIGLSAEILVFAILMVYRYREERTEKINLLQSKLAIQQSLTTSIVEAQENERKRIAEELHDGLGGFLTALRFMVNRNKNDFETKQNTEAKEVLLDVQQKLDSAIKDVREISHNLMPSDFATKAFTQILKEHLHYLNQNGNIRFDFYLDERVNNIPQPVQISLYRMVSELIRNIQTHSGATTATIQLVAHDASVLLQVEDNGNGFAPGPTDGIGLKNVQSRVAFHSGKMTIDSNKLNTTIHIEIPVSYAK